MRQSVAIVFGAFVMSLGGVQAAPAACDQTCVAIKRVLADRSANFAGLKGSLKAKEDPDDLDAWNANVTMPGLEACTIMNTLDAAPDTSQFGCYMADAPTAQAKAEFATLVAAFRAVSPAWTWFRDNDPRYPQAAGSISVFAGPARGKYIADIELNDRGATSLLTLKITSNPHTTGLRLAPYTR